MAVRLALRADEKRAWYWAHLVGRDRPLVAVRDHDVEIPRGRSLEVRASGLWADLVCETPMDHWTIGLEAFGVAFDDPRDALGAERGDPTALGLDLEWEAAGPTMSIDAGADAGNAMGGRYEQACTVHGELLAGSERIQIDSPGHRYHAWGPVDWWADSWIWAAGRLGLGAPFCHQAPAPAQVGPALLGPLETEADGVEISAVPVFHAPVAVPGTGGRAAYLARALCRMEAHDGRSGYGWAERLSRTAGSP